MKKRILIGTLIVFAAVALVVAFSGCDLVAYLTTDIDGRVVNAKADGTSSEWWKYSTDTLEGATVQLFRENSAGTGFESTAYETGTVESDGTYDMFNVPTGRYKLTGTKSDWIFVPRVVTISGADAILPDLIAYPNPGGVANNQVIIFLSWENLDHDLDAHLTWSDGSNRHDVYADVTTGDSGNLVLERDILDPPDTDSSFPRVETMLIKGYSESGIKNDTDFNALSNPPNNQLRFYAHCFDASADNTSLTGEEGVTPSAWGQVDVMYGNNHFGSWELPYNTAEETLWVVTIDHLGSNSFWIYSAGNANYINTVGFKSFNNMGAVVPVDEIK